MSGFILKRGAHFAAKYKEFASKPLKTEVNSETKVSEVKSEDTKPVIAPPEAVRSKEPDEESIVSLDDSVLSDDDSEPVITLPEAVCYKEPDQESLVSLDDSVMSEEDEEFNQKFTEVLNVKLKFDGKFHRFVVEYDSPIWKYLDTFYKTLGVSKKSHQLVIIHEDKILSMKDTPRSLNLSVVDILECYAKERSDSEDSRKKRHKEPKDPNILELKFRNNEDGKHASPIVLKIKKDSTMDKIMEEYAQVKGHQLTNLKFEFDGEHLTGEETPLDLEMEDGSLIDVTIRKPK